MADQIGYFPDYFENIARPLLDDAQHEPLPGDSTGQERPTTVASVPPAPAPWITAGSFFDDDGAVTTRVEVTDDAIDLLDPTAIELSPDPDLLQLWLGPKRKDRRLRMTADAIAVYRPWHLHTDDWGIYVSEDALTGFAGGLARLTGAPVGQVAPLALRQVLEHEWTHFAYEVAATEVEDVRQELLYPGYVGTRFASPSRYCTGPLEEVVASWAEVEFARSPAKGFRRLRPRGYKRAVESLLAIDPPGYRDYHLMSDWDTAVEIVASVMSLIAERTITTWRWGRAELAEKAQVPVYWVGDPVTAGAFGAFPKSVGPPSIRRVQKWLRHIGATRLAGRGKGSHEWWRLPDGTAVGFGTSQRFLLPPETKNLAEALGLSRQELMESIARMSRLQTPTPSR